MKLEKRMYEANIVNYPSKSIVVDERVFNKTKYPDFDKFHDNILLDTSEVLEYGDIYDRWVRSVGGNKNVFLRDFLSKFRLA